MKAIIMDVDQVLLDYSGRLREYVNSQYGKSIRGLPDKWDLTGWLELSSQAEANQIMDDFSRSFEFGTLDAFPGADVVLHQFLREGYALICLTACGTEDITVALRRANLFHRFGDIFEEVNFVDRTDSKREVLSRICSEYDVKAFFDDKPENIMDAIGLDINHLVLMKSPHNREFRGLNPEDIDTAFSWYDCKQILG